MTRREALLAALPAIAQGGLSVRSEGAKGDGAALDTKAIQAAIDRVAAAGGGTVVFPPGVYLSGTLVLRSGVVLHLPAGAVLRGSPKLEHYPTHTPSFRSYTDNYTEKSLIYAEKAANVGIIGEGVIDGQGAAFHGPYKVRPYLMRFVECRDVAVRGVRLENSPMWVQHYLACDGVHLSGLTVRSRVNGNNDGIDIDSCHRVRISDCDISSGDDAICLKSTSARECRDVVVSNCVVSSHCNAIKLGTESHGGFDNVVVSNCALYDTRLGGIAVEVVDGGTLRNVAFSNITMRDVLGPVFVRLGDRGRTYLPDQRRPGVGSLEGVRIEGVRARGAGRIGCSITGLPGAPVRGVVLRDVRISFVGGGTAEDARRAVPELPEKYPEYSMFGPLPAYGLYCRHVEDLALHDVRLETAAPDARPAKVFEDVKKLDERG